MLVQGTDKYGCYRTTSKSYGWAVEKYIRPWGMKNKILVLITDDIAKMRLMKLLFK